MSLKCVFFIFLLLNGINFDAGVFLYVSGDQGAGVCG